MKTSKFAALVITLTLGHGVACAWAADAPPTAPPPPQKPIDKKTPINQRATAEAWAAFRAGQHALAIAKADECIDRYQPAADNIQAILERDRATLPTGAVSEAERQRIYRFQILHDVATCLLIKAWVAEQQGRKDEATKSYAKAKNYSYARATERAGEPLWSPAEVAAQQLNRLSQ